MLAYLLTWFTSVNMAPLSAVEVSPTTTWYSSIYHHKLAASDSSVSRVHHKYQMTLILFPYSMQPKTLLIVYICLMMQPMIDKLVSIP